MYVYISADIEVVIEASGVQATCIGIIVGIRLHLQT